MTHQHKTHPSTEAGKSAAVKEAERRTSDRQLFAATAEVIEEVTGARFATRTMDLGPGGCFIDTTNPLPVGTRVHVRISKGKSEFRTDGMIVYSQSGMGMGVSFVNLSDSQQSDLQAWLSDGIAEKPASIEHHPVVRHAEAPDAKSMRAITRLLRLLVTKGMLTEGEASSILLDHIV
ncbi:MAG TPA: PilZ domain-containing protein [Candidatus Acidoferrum sp.]|nr:PilZ domain-containing protein [Candidatus Acidoferrum sp.]